MIPELILVDLSVLLLSFPERPTLLMIVNYQNSQVLPDDYKINLIFEDLQDFRDH
jgi:hypothetical protein